MAPQWAFRKVAHGVRLLRSVLFVIDLKTRCVQIAGIVHDPYGAWMEQIARNLTDVVDGFLSDRNSGRCFYFLSSID